MTKGLGGLGGNAGAMVAGAFAAAVLALGAWIGSTRNSVPPVDATTQSAAIEPAAKSMPAPDTAATPAPDTTQPASTQSATADSAPLDPTPDSTETETDPVEVAKISEATPTPIPPAFDEVRREPDGMTVIAGRAAPGAQVKVLRDGAEVANATADGLGKFAALAMIAPDGKGHVLSLEQITPGGAIASLDEILLAPVSAIAVDADAGAAPTSAAEQGATPDTDPVIVAEAAPAAPESPASSAPNAPVADRQTPLPSGDASPETAPEESPSVAADAEATSEPAPISPAQTAAAPIATDSAPVASPEPVTAPQGGTAQTGTPQPQAPQAQAPQAAEPATGDTAVAPEPPTVAATAAPDATAPAASGADDEPAADAPVAVLKSTVDGVERIDTTPPEVMDTVALDTIGYSDEGAVQLAGRAQVLARQVRVYLDNRAIISLPVDPDGRWRGDLPSVDAGIYTLRLDELSQDGSVISRVETPFKRESASVLAAATQGPDGPLKAVTVQKGDTLWAISRERYGDPLLYVRVFEVNAKSIRDPDLIYPGQVFDLPD